MTCPRCQKELQEGQKGKRCPHCGWFASRFKWLAFLCALLLPPLLTLLSATIMRLAMSNPRDEGLSPFVAVIGGAIGGIICGILLAFRATKNIRHRVVLSALLSAVMIVVCLALCLFGCTAGGYQFTID
jgi:predicted permease